ncbi:MAG: hypothetical protein COA47_10410 [Robiginitomaculum sp.]|nr:MAG: hypothetical protein COA47_10410 [Robiginitomaculum sp.]
MAFLVEDGSTVDGANSYSTVADADTYHTDRNNVTWLALSTAAKQAALIKASDYIDQRFSFIGWRRTKEQGLDWPRFDAYDDDDFLLDGVPPEVLKAVAEYALLTATAPLFLTPTYAASGQDIKTTRKKVGPIDITTTFQDAPSSTKNTIRELPEADNYLSGLTISGTQILRA